MGGKNQTILFGIENLSAVLQDSSKFFLVCGDSFHSLHIKNMIVRLKSPHVIFSAFSPNPIYEDICKGFDLYKETGCDSILAVGGGSSIDVAKCIKLAVLSNEGIAVIKPPLASINVQIERDFIPLIAIPTTAGSGSESTQNAVAYFNDTKQTVTNRVLLPDYAILEPSVLKTLPLYQKKCTMMDALCQGIESWWSVNSTEESYEYSRKSIELIMANWRKYIFENNDEAAKQIMLAANYGGRAINITQTTAAHAFSYKITSLYKLPHGHAVAVCLPEIWEYMIGHMDKCIDVRGQEYLAGVFAQISKSMGCEAPDQAIAFFRLMMREMDLKNPVAEYNNEEIGVLSHSVNSVRLKNNPVVIDEMAIKTLYQKILKS